MALTLRTIGNRDYEVRDNGQRVGRIRFAVERNPGKWLWHVLVHLPAGTAMGSAASLDLAKADFRTAWEGIKAKHSPEALAEAYKAMNIRDL